MLSGMLHPELREIQAALSLVRRGCFAGAASELGVTQPAVSHRIAKLEQILGFPMFHRRQEGTTLTEEGAALIPLMEEIDSEFRKVLRRVSYWKRANRNQLNILIDGSVKAQAFHFKACSDGFAESSENWISTDTCVDWVGALSSFEADLVLGGSFLEVANLSGIETAAISVEGGVTVVWNPDYYFYDKESFSFPEAVSSTVILPPDRIAVGFQKFVSDWCKNTYGFQLSGMIKAATEADAVQVCKQGMGVLLLPGDAERRLDLQALGLATFHLFKSLLPTAYTFGVRYRTDERNPQVLKTVTRLRRGDD